MPELEVGKEAARGWSVLGKEGGKRTGDWTEDAEAESVEDGGHGPGEEEESCEDGGDGEEEWHFLLLFERLMGLGG